MACNFAIVCPTKEYLPPSCSLRDSASDEIVFIMQSLNMATIVGRHSPNGVHFLKKA